MPNSVQGSLVRYNSGIKCGDRSGTVTQNIKKLKRTLFDYEEAENDLKALEAKKADGTISDSKYDAGIVKGHKRTDAASQSVADARSALIAEVEKSQKNTESLRSAVAALENEPAGEVYLVDKREREQLRLQQQLEQAETREDLLKQAAAAKCSKDLTDIADRIDQEPTRNEEGFPTGRSTYTDFPGLTVPERLILLFREIKRNPQVKRPIAISSALIGAILLTIFGVLIVSGMRNDAGDTPSVLGRGDVLAPILVNGVEDVGGLEITLAYDEQVLTGLSVMPGSLASAAYIESNVSTPGVVAIAIIDTTGITGSGELVIVRFRTDHIVVDPVPLTLSSSAAYHAISLEPIPFESEDGWVNTGNLSVMAPVLDFSQ